MLQMNPPFVSWIKRTRILRKSCYLIHRDKITVHARVSNSCQQRWRNGGQNCGQRRQKMCPNTVEHTIKPGRNGVWVQPSWVFSHRTRASVVLMSYFVPVEPANLTVYRQFSASSKGFCKGIEFPYPFYAIPCSFTLHARVFHFFLFAVF